MRKARRKARKKPQTTQPSMTWHSRTSFLQKSGNPKTMAPRTTGNPQKTTIKSNNLPKVASNALSSSNFQQKPSASKTTESPSSDDSEELSDVSTGVLAVSIVIILGVFAIIAISIFRRRRGRKCLKSNRLPRFKPNTTNNHVINNNSNSTTDRRPSDPAHGNETQPPPYSEDRPHSPSKSSPSKLQTFQNNQWTVYDNPDHDPDQDRQGIYSEANEETGQCEDRIGVNRPKGKQEIYSEVSEETWQSGGGPRIKTHTNLDQSKQPEHNLNQSKGKEKEDVYELARNVDQEVTTHTDENLEEDQNDLNDYYELEISDV